MARRQGLQEQPLWRAAVRCHHSHQDARTSTGRQLRRLGWHVQHIRLRRQGGQEKGGCVCATEFPPTPARDFANAVCDRYNAIASDPNPYPIIQGLTRRRLPVSSRAARWPSEAGTRRRGTVPLAVPSCSPSSRVSVSVSRRCLRGQPSWR